MKKYYAIFIVDCSTQATFMAEEGLTKEQLEHKAWEAFNPGGLCHQCAGDYEIGDSDLLDIEVVE